MMQLSLLTPAKLYSDSSPLLRTRAQSLPSPSAWKKTSGDQDVDTTPTITIGDHPLKVVDKFTISNNM